LEDGLLRNLPSYPAKTVNPVAYGETPSGYLRGPGAPHEVFATLRCCIDHAADEIGMLQLRLPACWQPYELGSPDFLSGLSFFEVRKLSAPPWLSHLQQRISISLNRLIGSPIKCGSTGRERG
jgi:hypothetical protein